MKLTIGNFYFIGLCLEGFLYGLYSGIFCMYLQNHWATKTGTDKTTNIVFYALCALYVLSVVTIVIDITSSMYQNPTANLHFGLVQGTVTGCCDFLAQSILIYRCWIVWGCNIRVVIIPSILAVTFLAMWLAGNSSEYISSDQAVALPNWGFWLGVASTAMSMTVNALVTGLIIFKIFNVYRRVKSTSDDQNFGATAGESKIRTVIFVLIESGMVLFSIQLARLLLDVLPTTEATLDAFGLIVYIHQMLNGITPTIIIVRVSMGLSFHDKESTIKSTIGSLRFAATNLDSKSIPETEGDVGIVNGDDDIGIVNGDDDIGVRLSDDIQMVDRIP